MTTRDGFRLFIVEDGGIGCGQNWRRRFRTSGNAIYDRVPSLRDLTWNHQSHFVYILTHSATTTSLHRRMHTGRSFYEDLLYYNFTLLFFTRNNWFRKRAAYSGLIIEHLQACNSCIFISSSSGQFVRHSTQRLKVITLLVVCVCPFNQQRCHCNRRPSSLWFCLPHTNVQFLELLTFV